MPHVDNGPGALNRLLEDVYNQCLEQRASVTTKDHDVCNQVAWTVAQKHGWYQQEDGTWAQGIGHNMHETGIVRDDTPMVRDNPAQSPNGSIVPTIKSDVVTPDIAPATHPDGGQDPYPTNVDKDKALYGQYVERKSGRTVNSDTDTLQSPPFNGPGAQRASVGDQVPGGISDDRPASMLSMFESVEAALTFCDEMCNMCTEKCTTEQRAKQFKVYPWEKCIADRKRDGYSPKAAAKICGSIRARNS